MLSEIRVAKDCPFFQATGFDFAVTLYVKDV